MDKITIFIIIFFLLYFFLSEIYKYKLENKIVDLSKNFQKLLLELENLTTGLKSPHIAGRWGELQLKSFLEQSGLLPYCDFSLQQFKSSDKSQGKPDVALKLPNNGVIFIDSKVPLSNYLEMLQTNDIKNKEYLRKQHLKNLKAHIVELGKREYWKDVNSPEFVILYIPTDGVILSVLDLDASILNLAYENKVFLSSPINLFISLNMVGKLWLHHKSESNENFPKAIHLIEDMSKLHEEFLSKIKIMEKDLDYNYKLINSFLKEIKS